MMCQPVYIYLGNPVDFQVVRLSAWPCNYKTFIMDYLSINNVDW